MKSMIAFIAAFCILVSADGILAPRCFCPVADENGAIIQMTLDGVYADTVESEYGAFVRYFIPTGGYVGDVGTPRIPTWSTLVAIPPTSAARVEFVKAEWDTLHDVMLYPVQNPLDEQDFAFDSHAYSNGTYPGSTVDLGQPAILRDIRVVPLDFYPFRYNAKTRTLLIARQMTAQVIFEGMDMRNASSDEYHYVSEVFLPLYESAVANFWFYERNLQIRKGTILYILPDSCEDDMQPLIDWKRKSGCRVRVALSQRDVGDGNDPDSIEIKQYIQNAYDTWEYPPDYVILGGDCYMADIMDGTRLPDFEYRSPFTTWLYPSDHPYAMLAGDDYLADLMVGRIAIDYETEAQTYAQKVVTYETDPLRDGSDWLERGIEIAANCCGSPQPQTPRLVTLWHRTLAMMNGYTEVESVYCYGYDCPRGASFISSFINEGTAFVNYRGWAGTEGWHFPEYRIPDVLGLANGWKQPIILSIVCGTGNFDGSMDPCFGEAWIRGGTPTNPKGGCAFYGPTDQSTHTKWNNPLSEGFWWGFYEEELTTFGLAVMRSKITLYLAYPNDRDIGTGVDHYQYVYNILSDPSLRMWKGVPTEISAEHALALNGGNTVISLDVSVSGEPIEDALVSIWFFENDAYTAYTDENGITNVAFPAEETMTHDSVSLVITADGHIPYIAVLPIESGDMIAALTDCIIDDDASGESDGNGDGIISSGETIELWLTLYNAGTEVLTSVFAGIAENDFFTAVLDSTYFGDIAIDTSVSAGTPIVIAMNENIEDSTQTTLRFSVSETGGALDAVAYAVIMRSPAITVAEVTPDGDAILSPGETADLTIELQNEGSIASGDATIEIESGTWISAVTTSGAAASIMPGETGAITPDIAVTVDSNIISGVVDTLTITFSDGFTNQTFACPVLIGKVLSGTFGGPDPYGYYCYDNTDDESGRAPLFQWMELHDTTGTGTGIELGDDETIVLPLPFDFQYYGETYTSIGICSNGWIAVGDVSDRIFWNFYNRPLPDPSGPWGMICPFWDDIDPSPTGYGVYYEYFPTEHIFVIEWNTVNTFDDSTDELFELILRDVDHYPTPTGDGEMIFQYMDIADIDEQISANDIAEFSTIGLEEPNQVFGFQYSYCGYLADHAAPLENGLAILWTTNEPVALAINETTRFKKPGKLSMHIAPNPFNPSLSITIEVDDEQDVCIEVMDVSGKLIKTVAHSMLYSGKYHFTWNGMDKSGARMPSGIYLIRAITRDGAISKKAMLVR